MLCDGSAGTHRDDDGLLAASGQRQSHAHLLKLEQGSSELGLTHTGAHYVLGMLELFTKL